MFQGKAGKIIRLLRIMRILRIFKMVRHFTGLQSLIYTLRQVFNVPILKLNINQAWRELGLILIIVLIIMLMFSSLLFAFERDGEQNIITILYLGPSPESWGFVDCIWWVIGLANFQVESDDPDHGGLPHAAPGPGDPQALSSSPFSDHARPGCVRSLCPFWHLHPHPAHPYSSHQLCRHIQEQAVEE